MNDETKKETPAGTPADEVPVVDTNNKECDHKCGCANAWATLSAVPFRVRMNMLRAELISRDWTDDKMFTGGARSYGYVSHDKAMRNISPLFHKYGLEFKTDFSELTQRDEIGGMSQHWTIKINATIFDTLSNEFETGSAYGEAGDSGDKGVNKAQTDAVKQWLFHTFHIADGIDPDGEDESTVSAPRTYKPATAAEQELVKSKAFAKSLDVPAPAKKTVAPPAPAKKTVAPPAPAKKEEPTLKFTPKDAPKEKKADLPPSDAVVETPVTPNQLNTIAAISKKVRNDAEDGIIPWSTHDDLIKEKDAIKNGKQAVAFIEKWSSD